MAPILYPQGNNNKKIDLCMFNTDLVLSEYFQLNPYGNQEARNRKPQRLSITDEKTHQHSMCKLGWLKVTDTKVKITQLDQRTHIIPAP